MNGQKFGFMGTGHAGSRFVDTLLGLIDNHYPALTLNSAVSDLKELKVVPLNNRIHIQLPDEIDGAGKDPELGRKAVLVNEDKIRNKIKQEFKDVSKIYLVFSSGGGTGRGSAKELMRILDDMGFSFGTIMIEPFKSEGYQPIVNTFTAYKEIADVLSEYKNATGVTLLDNQQISSLDRFKNLSIEDFYASANRLVAQSFHLFNVATTKKGIENFDTRDYIKCTNAKGFMTLGTLNFDKKEIQNKSIFIDKLNETLEYNLFTKGLDITTATHAALILFIPKSIIDQLDREVLFAPFEELGRVLDGATVFKGIYPIKDDQVKMYILISGMDFPREKIKNIGEYAKQLHSKTKSKIQKLKKTDDLFGDMSFNLNEDDLDLSEDNNDKKDNENDFDFSLD